MLQIDLIYLIKHTLTLHNRVALTNEYILLSGYDWLVWEAPFALVNLLFHFELSLPAFSCSNLWLLQTASP